MVGAVSLIGESGLIGFTVRELARRLRVSHNAYTRHFQDKGDLLARIAEEGQRELDAQMKASSDTQLPLLERLRQGGLAYVSFALREPVRYSVMFDYPYPYGTYPDLDQIALETFGTMVVLIEKCQENGLFPGDARLHASICWAALHGVAKLLTTGRLHYETDAEKYAFADAAVTNLLGDWPAPNKNLRQRTAQKERFIRSGASTQTTSKSKVD